MTDEPSPHEERLRVLREQVREQIGDEALVALEGSISGAIERYVSEVGEAEVGDSPAASWSPAGPVDTSLDPDREIEPLEPGLVSSGVHADARLLEILGFIPEAPSLVADRRSPTSLLEQREADLISMPQEPPEPPSLPSPKVYPAPSDESTTYIENGAPKDRPIFRSGRWITPRERGIR